MNQRSVESKINNNRDELKGGVSVNSRSVHFSGDKNDRNRSSKLSKMSDDQLSLKPSLKQGSFNNQTLSLLR